MNTNINCPNCGSSFELSETLAAPLIQSIKDAFNKRLLEANSKASQSREKLNEALSKIQLERQQIKTEISKGIAAKQKEIEAEIRKQLQAQLTADMESDLQAKEDRIKQLDSKIREAKQAELKALKDKQQAEDQANQLQIELQKQLELERSRIREEAQTQAEDAKRLEVAQLRKQLADTNEKLQEAQRKAELTSQQLQGEVAELDLERALTRSFPWDEIEEVKKGQRGADCLQHIHAEPGLNVGTILWEVKRAQNWASDWTDKAKHDGRSCSASVVVIVSDVLPKGIELFGEFEGVWVTKPSCAVALATALRSGLINSASARKIEEGKGDKAILAYAYLMGPDFRARVAGLAEPFDQLLKDHNKEKAATLSRWARRERYLNRAMESAMGMLGDLQALAGQEIEGLELLALGSGEEDVIEG